MNSVLYIDDDPMMLKGIGAYLSEAGFLVFPESSGADGLQRFRRVGADVVLLDLIMPGMSGLEVLGAIRKDDPDVPIIVLSASDEVQDAANAVRLGASDYLIKPIPDLAVLDHALRRAMERRELILENRRYRMNLEEEVQRRTDRLEEEMRIRELSETELRTSLRETETLLRDIHHRVKNNLQIISSLISLQSNFIRDPDSLRMFRRSLNRIRSIALVHEELHRSENLTRIDFRRYVDSLVDYLFQVYEVPDRIRRLPDIEKIQLNIQTAIPCGLIVNELVTNAIVHAFPGDRPGTIGVELRREGDRLRLSVRDDGTGIPESVDPLRPTTLGFQLLVNLASQLRGTLELDRTSGSRISILLLPE